MRIGLISDIHGNYEALTRVLIELERLGASEIYCLGDVVGYYTQINECCNELRQRQIPVIMGNHDWYFAGGGQCPRSRSVNDCLRYLRTVITEENLNWLRSFPVQRHVHGVHMVHGGWSDPIDEYLKITPEYFDTIPGSYFASGHTHIQTIEKLGTKVYCNPGSVGQPRDEDPRAAFATFEGGVFELHRVDYDMQKVFDLMEAAGFNDYYYGGLKYGAKNLRRL
jgi:putative phosphoesterase